MKNSKILKGQRTLLVFVFVSLVLMLLDYFFGAFGLKNFFQKTTISLRNKVYQRSVNLRKGLAIIIGNNKELQEPVDEKRALKNGLDNCRLQLNSLKEENASIRKSIGTNLGKEIKLEPAKIFGISQEIIFVGAGENEGIKKDAWVISGNVIVGRVVEVFASHSLVRLLSSEDSKISVKIWSQPEADLKNALPLGAGVLVGDGRGLTVKEVLAKENINKTDLVGVVDNAGLFLVGEVEKVWQSQDGVYREATVDWRIDPKDLITVLVVKSE